MNRAQLAVYRLQLALPVFRNMGRIYVRTVKRMWLAAFVGAGRNMAIELSHAATAMRKESGLPPDLAERACGDVQTLVVLVDAFVLWASRHLAACDS